MTFYSHIITPRYHQGNIIISNFDFLLKIIHCIFNHLKSRINILILRSYLGNKSSFWSISVSLLDIFCLDFFVPSRISTSLFGENYKSFFRPVTSPRNSSNRLWDGLCPALDFDLRLSTLVASALIPACSCETSDSDGSDGVWFRSCIICGNSDKRWNSD